MNYDCAVVGAGPAGCAAALYLARAGRRVALLDRASFPRPKPCGEGILHGGVAVLRELGVYEQAAAAGRVLEGIVYVDRAGREARGRFSRGHGLAIARESLDELLLRRAQAAAGVTVLEGRVPLRVEARREGVAVRLPDGTLSARRLIAADGLGSPTLGALGVGRASPERPRVGLSARVAGVAGVGGFVEVFLIEDGELYLTPQPGEGRATLALLLARDAWPKAGRDEAFWAFARSHPALAPRLRSARLESPVAGRGPLASAARRWEGPGWLAAGDAAGGVDPLVGDGIGLALRGGRLAAEATESALRGEGAGGYSRRRRALLRRKQGQAALLLTLSRRPALGAAAVSLLGRFPSLFDALLGAFDA